MHEVFTQYGDLLSEQLTSDEHINLTPDLVMLVNEFGLDFAMAFQILRPRLNAELERVKSEEKAAVQKRLAAEKQALSQRIASPTKEASPALPSPKSAAIQLDGEEAGDIVMEDGKEELVNGTITLIPPPKSTSVSGIIQPNLTCSSTNRLGRRYGGHPHLHSQCNKREACFLRRSMTS